MRVPRSIFRAVRHPRPRRDRAHAGAGRCAGPRPLPALGARPARAGAPILAVGRDNRPSGERLAAALRAGIAAAGGDGGGRRRGARRRRSTSPCTPWAPTAACRSPVRTIPPEFNGFKMVLAGESGARRRRSRPCTSMIIAESVARRRRARDHRRLGAAALPGRDRQPAPARPPGARSWWTAATASASLVAVADPAGARRRGGAALLRVGRHLSQPPSRPDRPREPRATCRREVRRTGAELGIAFDGDADRIGAVDETGAGHLRRPAARPLRPGRRPPLRAGHRRHLRRQVLRRASPGAGGRRRAPGDVEDRATR